MAITYSTKHDLTGFTATPIGITYISSIDKFWITSDTYNTVSVYNSSPFGYDGTWDYIGSATPAGLGYVSATDLVWVTDQGTTTVYLRDPSTRAAPTSGATTYTLNSGNTNAKGVTYVSSTQKVWVADDGSTKRAFLYNTDGTYDTVYILANAGSITGIAYIPEYDEVWVADNTANSIRRYSTSGTYIAEVSLHANNTNPSGLAATTGNLWVLDTANDAYQYAITSPPSFGTATLSDKSYVVGDTDSFQGPEATGGVGTKTYSASALPAGVSFDATTRTFSVNATEVVAQTQITYRVTDSDTPAVTRTLTFNITILVPSFGTPTDNEKSIIFAKPLNDTTTPASAGDNDYSTYTSSSTVTITLDSGRSFDYLFVKCSGVVSYTATLDGLLIASRTIPQYLTGVSELGNVSIVRHGYQHDLLSGASHTGTTLVFNFTGSNIRVAEVMVLKKIASIKKLEQITHAKVDTDSETVASYLGEVRNKEVTGIDALRWVSNYTIEFTQDDENWEKFADMIEDNIEGVVWADEPERKPWRVYRAIFSQDRYDAPYISEWKPGGNHLSFEVREDRPVSAAWFTLDTFNTNSTGDGVMFFRECAHLGENGVVDDQDPDTASTDTTHTFDVDGVSHVYLSATGVTSFAVQTLVSNVWTTQETVTPTQKTYRGWDHSVSALTTRLTGISQVRLVFTGTAMKINEILCLDRAGEILSDQQALLSKVFRKAVTHEKSRGGFVRTTVPGAERMKWALQMNNTFGHLDTFDSEDFMDWLTLHRNFVISYIPNDFPWRTFLATTQTRRFENVFLTRILQNGDAVACGVIER